MFWRREGRAFGTRPCDGQPRRAGAGQGIFFLGTAGGMGVGCALLPGGGGGGGGSGQRLVGG